MRYLSLFSGIEAATQAWWPLGWDPVAFAEIEPFPSAVLAHHYPHVPNLGDITKHREWPDIGTVDLICGGSPCQSFSVAGLRKGMDDPRGNLALTYLAVVDQYRPKWVVYENVPGLLSSNGGRDFGSLLGGLGELGYGFAYRVLDAQFVRVGRFPFAVPQRRRRVFVVGHLGDWRRAAAVLFDRESLSGHPAPRREAGQIAPTIPARSLGGGGLGTDFDCDGGLIAANSGNVGYCLTASAQQSLDAETETLIAVAHALRGEGFDASEDGTGRGTPLVPVAYGLTTEQTPKFAEGHALTLTKQSPTGGGQPQAVAYRTAGDGAVYDEGDVTAPLTTATDPSAQIVAIQERAVSENLDAGPQGKGWQEGVGYTLEARNKVQAVAFDLNQITSKTNRSQPDPAVHHTLPASSCAPHLAQPWAVRRLTPEECEALQGFPRGFTRIPYRGKPAEACPDGPRYKALGNSWAVNCATWIGERIAEVDQWSTT